MNELQTTISNLKQGIRQANQILEQLESQEVKPKPRPVFPVQFIGVEDEDVDGSFVIGLDSPSVWDELPRGFKGRACFSRASILKIITGLQPLIGEKDD